MSRRDDSGQTRLAAGSLLVPTDECDGDDSQERSIFRINIPRDGDRRPTEKDEEE